MDLIKDSKILVVGGAGFVGSNLVHYLLENHDPHAEKGGYSLNSADKELPEYIRSNFLGRGTVYQNDPRLVCDMWSIVKGKAAKFGYRPY